MTKVCLLCMQYTLFHKLWWLCVCLLEALLSCGEVSKCQHILFMRYENLNWQCGLPISSDIVLINSDKLRDSQIFTDSATSTSSRRANYRVISNLMKNKWEMISYSSMLKFNSSTCLLPIFRIKGQWSNRYFTSWLLINRNNKFLNIFFLYY